MMQMREPTIRLDLLGLSCLLSFLRTRPRHYNTALHEVETILLILQSILKSFPPLIKFEFSLLKSLASVTSVPCFLVAQKMVPPADPADPTHPNPNPPVLARVPTASPAEERAYRTQRRNDITAAHDLLRQTVEIDHQSMASLRMGHRICFAADNAALRLTNEPSVITDVERELQNVVRLRGDLDLALFEVRDDQEGTRQKTVVLVQQLHDLMARYPDEGQIKEINEAGRAAVSRADDIVYDCDELETALLRLEFWMEGCMFLLSSTREEFIEETR